MNANGATATKSGSNSNKKKPAGIRVRKRRVRVQVTRMVKTPPAPAPARAKPDPRVRSWSAMIRNPASGPVVKGLVSDPLTANSAVIRRTNVVSLDLTAVSGTLSGVEIVVVLSSTVDPYIVYSTGNSAIAPYFNAADAATRSLVAGFSVGDNIPAGSRCRINSACVKATYIGTNDSAGGMWLTYPWRKETGNDEDGLDAWGDLYNGQKYALGSTRADNPNGCSVHLAPETSFTPVYVNGTGLLSGGMPGPETPCSLIRLLYVGPKQCATWRFEISSVLEYYHSSHRQHMTPTPPHPHGETLHTAVSTHMHQVGGNNNIDVHKSSGVLDVIDKVASGISQAFQFAERIIPYIEAGADALAAL